MSFGTLASTEKQIIEHENDKSATGYQKDKGYASRTKIRNVQV